MQLAEANIAWMRYAAADLRMRPFMDALDAVNAEADRQPGFVWRLQTEAGNSTGIRAFDDDRILFNLSVWRSLAELFEYAYSGRHREFFARRREWFVPPDRAPVVLWWVTEGHRPGVSEALERFDVLWTRGPGPRAFDFRRPFDPDGRPMAADWRRGVRGASGRDFPASSG